MTVATTLNRVAYAGNGVTTVFSFPNKFLADADLVVLSVNNTTGVETLKVLTTDYTVTGAGGPAGGNVTMLVAPAAGTTLVIYRDPALTQPIDPVNGDPLNVDTQIEAGFDRATLQIQRLNDLVSRAIHIPDGDSGFTNEDLELPPKVVRANNLLAFDSNGKPVAQTAALFGAVLVSPFWEGILAETTRPASLNALLETTDPGWDSNHSVMQLAPQAAVFAQLTDTPDSIGLVSNLYFDGTDWRRVAANASTLFYANANADTPEVAAFGAVTGAAGGIATLFEFLNARPGVARVDGHASFSPPGFAAGDAVISANAAAVGDSAVIGLLKGLLYRGFFFSDTTAETGSDAGSDLQIATATDAGAFKENVLTFSRASGLGTVKADPTAALGIATKQYVDAKYISTANAIAAGSLSAAQGASDTSNITGTFAVNAGDIVEVSLATTGSLSGTAGQLYAMSWGATGITLDAVDGPRSHLCVFGNGAVAAMGASRARVTVGGTCQLVAVMRNVATAAGTITINTPTYNIRVYKGV